MKKGNSPLVNGIILLVVVGFLCWYFSAHAMWNAATIFVIALIASLTAGQFLIYIFLFRKK